MFLRNLPSDEMSIQVFLCEYKAGSEMPTHFHTEDEYATVIQGMIGDRLTGEVCPQGECMFFPAGRPHKPFTLVDSIYLLTYIDAQDDAST